jgi:adenosylcobinamide kinase/adenosylcobinamide-phosphate guanylyltransferase
MGTLIFITGGARSGKSRLATELAAKAGKNVAFIATAQALDKEMENRIDKHKNSRPASWKTIEEPLNVATALAKLSQNTKIVIIDCLTLLVTNLMLAEKTNKQIQDSIKKMICAAQKTKATVIVVSNEVGAGIVPENKMARDFRDVAGIANQIVAKASDQAYAMFAGYPVKLK